MENYINHRSFTHKLFETFAIARRDLLGGNKNPSSALEQDRLAYRPSIKKGHRHVDMWADNEVHRWSEKQNPGFVHHVCPSRIVQRKESWNSDVERAHVHDALL